MLECYQEECNQDTDIRRHMSRPPLTEWGTAMVMEFKSKGAIPMSIELTTFIKDKSLHRTQWPCKDYYHESRKQQRKAKRITN